MSDYFYKYQYPNTNRLILIQTLQEFGFKIDYEDDWNTYLTNNDIKVIVTKEDEIKALSIYDIRHQSRISDEDFSRVLKEKRNHK